MPAAPDGRASSFVELSSSESSLEKQNASPLESHSQHGSPRENADEAANLLKSHHDDRSKYIDDDSDTIASSSDSRWASLYTLLGLSPLCNFVWDSGIICMAIASFLQSLSALFVKLTDDRVPVFEMVAIRSLSCMIATLVIIFWRRVTPVFGPSSSLWPLIVRGCAGALSMSLYYFAIMQLPLPDAMTIFFTHPAMVIGLAWICRGERVGWGGVVGMLASLVGVTLVAQPPVLTGGAAWSEHHLIGVGLCLAAAFLAAAAFVSIRFVPKSVASMSVALWFHTMGVATSVPPLLFQVPKAPVIPGLLDASMIAGIAVCSFSSHAFIARAFLVDQASRVAAAGYLQVVFAHVYGILLLHDPESMLGILGSLVICCGVIAVSWSQPKSGSEAGDSKQAVSQETAPEAEDDATLEMLPLVDEDQKLAVIKQTASFSTSEPLTTVRVQS